MSPTRALLLFGLLAKIHTSSNEHFTPSTIINVSVFTEKLKKAELLNIVFIKGKVSFTDKSLQYYFFDDLLFTHTQISRKSPDSFQGTFGELKDILTTLLRNKTAMNKVTQITRTKINPFVFSFSNKTEPGIEETAALQHIEKQAIEGVFNDYTPSTGSFVLFGNHFNYKNNLFTSLPKPSQTNHRLIIHVEESYTTAATGGKVTGRWSPRAFSILKHDMERLQTQSQQFTTFNFLNSNGVFVRTELKQNDEEIYFEETALKEEDATFLTHLEEVFSLDRKASTPKEKLITKFIQMKFYNTLQSYINKLNTQLPLLRTILYENDIQECTFKEIDGLNLPEEIKGKFEIKGKIMPSFNEDVLFTNVNPFDVKEEVTSEKSETKETSETSESSETTESTESSNTIVTSDTKSTSTDKTSTTKKEEKSGGKIAIILLVVLLVIVAMGLVGFFYLVKVNKKTSRRIRS
eukprot:GAHX01001984.1.p1 GENE.GAHX01001984.1~~GAHX01001984.1.p1  ORF type:complete len:464 (-),score=96.93 GAHX01001984.1:46-1437(-)